MSDFWSIYENERDKLTILPDADADFIAFEAALNIYHRGEVTAKSTKGEDK